MKKIFALLLIATSLSLACENWSENTIFEIDGDVPTLEELSVNPEEASLFVQGLPVDFSQCDERLPAFQYIVTFFDEREPIVGTAGTYYCTTEEVCNDPKDDLGYCFTVPVTQVVEEVPPIGYEVLSRAEAPDALCEEYSVYYILLNLETGEISDFSTGMVNCYEETICI